MGEIEAKAVLLATGIRERPRAARMVPGTRPQGVYTTGSLQRFVHQEGLPVGKRAVIVGAELVSLSALLTLMHARTKCVGMVTEEATHQVEFPYVVMKWGMMDILRFAPLIANARVTNIFGQKRVEGIEITRTNNQTEDIECDSVIFTGNWISENEMARLGGLEIDPVTKAPKIDAGFRSSVDGVFVAGNLAARRKIRLHRGQMRDGRHGGRQGDCQIFQVRNNVTWMRRGEWLYWLKIHTTVNSHLRGDCQLILEFSGGSHV